MGHLDRKGRRDFLKTLGAGAATLLTPTWSLATAASGKRPNVIIVLTDDQGYGDLSCHGNPVLKTPHLDRLHGESLRLTDFHVAPMCAPTRGELMTGLDALRNGATCVCRGRSLIRRGIPTLADLFSSAGYRTGHFGKWHLGDNFPYRPQDRGFGDTVRHPAWGITSIPDHWTNDYFDDTYEHNGVRQTYAGYCTNVWFDEAIKWMRTIQKTEDPFFLYLATNAPHWPFWVAEEYSVPYAEFPREQAFYGMISNLDENMGRLLAMLDQGGLRDNTLLVFMTDNGTVLGDKVYNAGMRGRKSELYEGGHRVPCFIRWPQGDLSSARDIHELAHAQDLMPTLLELCGLQELTPGRLDGVSLAPLLRGSQQTLPERTLVIQYDKPEKLTEKWDCALLRKKWRLIRGKELYNIDIDPGQQQDLSAERPEVVQALRQHYEKWWAELEPARDDFCAITIGSEVENPVHLSSCDWNGVYADNFYQLNGDKNGPWTIQVERPGEYEFTLRRWPKEADAPLAAALEKPRFGKAKALPIARAKLKIRDKVLSQQVEAGAKAVRFRLPLKAGRASLQTWFLDDQGKELCGAYYVSVGRL